jgi:hypothetical protein
LPPRAAIPHRIPPSPARCNRRCEAVTSVEPQGYPILGFYCTLHGYQKPRQNPDGTLQIEPVFDEHLRRRTSFVAPEASIAAEMVKSPQLLRDRPGAPRSAAGDAILSWLMQRRNIAQDAALAYANRMVQLDILVPVAAPAAGGAGAAAKPDFVPDRASLYRIVAAPALPGARAP